jgi:hypothetical protein
MSKRYSGALITKTPVVPTSLSAPGIWSLSDQAAAQATNTWPFPRDPQFNYVTMLLHGDGSAGPVAATGVGAGVSTTVTNFNADASTNNFNVTINGDARSDNFTPYQGTGYYSNYFGGSGNSLNYPSASQYAIGTGNFTVEFFVNFASLNAGHNRMFCIGASGTDGLELDLNGTNLEVGIQNGYPIGYTWAPAVNTWYYVAVTRSGSTVTLYINGTSVATGTSSNSISQNSLSIGGISWVGSWSINGYLSNVRLSNTVRTIATPTTPYTSDANTLFLGAQSNRFLDTSSYVATATATGSPQVSPAQPFTLPTTVATYGSGYFDGTGDYLSLTPTSALNLSTNSWTIEMWVNLNTVSSTQVLINFGYEGSTQRSFILYLTSSNVLQFAYSTNGSNNTDTSLGASGITTGTWNHLAVVRNSTTITVYRNGVAYGTTITIGASAINYTPGAFRIGVDATNYTNGYITDCRIVNGTAVYTSAFTPPTTPLTAITNTSLLTTQYNGGGNNSGFKDSSQFNFPITRNGNTTQGTFTPYGSNWSNYFPNVPSGTSAIYVPDNVAFTFGSGNFTVEAWINSASSRGGSASAGVVYGQCSNVASNSNRSHGMQITDTALIFYFTTNGLTDQTVTWTTTFNLNTWYHIAIARSGSLIYGFVNGVLLSSQSFTATIFDSSASLAIGSFGRYPVDDGYTSLTFPGYISNFRIVKGTALYTASFTPSTTPLTAVTNTSVLTCQNNRFIDNSTNNLAVTTTGTPSVQRFSQFAPLTVYNPTTYGGSGYFDGSGDYLTSTSPNLTGTWTVEMWWYPLNVTSQQTFISFNSGSYQGINMWCNTSGQIVIDDGFNGQSAFTTTTFKANAWNHLAIVRNGTTTTGYINGVVAGSNSFTPSPTNTMMVGRYNSSPFYYVSGYITDIRVTNSTAVYTAAFTPPTAPLTAVTGTSLLVSTTNAGILDNAMMNNLETVGNAQVSTSVKKFGAASMYFDGSGDAAIAPASINLTFGTSDFTMEMWINSGANGTNTRTMGNLTASGWISGSWVIATTTPGNVNKFIFACNNYNSGADMLVSSVTANDSAWHHYAVTRSGNTWRLFIDGALQQTVTSSVSLDNGTSNRINIGHTGYASDGYWAGYIDDLRITKGVARYTATFTVPDQAFPNG